MKVIPEDITPLVERTSGERERNDAPMTKPGAEALTLEQRIAIARLVIDREQWDLEPRPFDPDALMAFLLPAGSGWVRDDRLVALQFVAGRAGMYGLLGTPLDAVEGAHELVAWLAEPNLSPIPRHWIAKFAASDCDYRWTRVSNPPGEPGPIKAPPADAL